MNRLGPAMTTAVAVFLLVGSPAGAATGPSWTIQTTPHEPGVNQPFLTSVSCPSATMCMAVAAGGGVAERWNGTKWRIKQVAVPAGASSVGLASVSCPSSASCEAVGMYRDSSGNLQLLAEAWDGTTWTVQPVPNPSPGDPQTFLASVSCSSAAACTAVGAYLGPDATNTLAERWDGSTWKVQSTPNPGDASDSLRGVSCPSATDCTAVGSQTSSDTEVDLSLAEHWDGAGWSVQSTPNPAGGTRVDLLAVSCTVTGACQSVGSYTNAFGNDASVAEGRSGASWALESPVHLRGELFSVSCSSDTACTAVGHQASRTLAEGWDGAAWSLQSTPNPRGTGRSLSGISCPSSTVCTAVGGFTNPSGVSRSLAERYA